MNSIKTVFLLALLTGLLLAVGQFAGGSQGMIIMLFVSILMNFVSYWYSDKIVLSMYGAQEVFAQDSPELIRTVSSLAQKAKMPMPKVYVISTDVPNAFATGRDPEHAVVAVTHGIVKALSSEELEGVIAHELSHIKNRDTLISTIVATIAGVITMIAHIARWGAVFGGFGRNSDDDNGGGGIVGFLFLVVLAPLAAVLIQLGVSRSREFIADESAARISGKPLALAAALQKIEHYAQQRVLPEATPATSHLFIINPLANTGDWLANLFSTHPSTSQRIERLNALAGHRTN